MIRVARQHAGTDKKQATLWLVEAQPAWIT